MIHRTYLSALFSLLCTSVILSQTVTATVAGTCYTPFPASSVSQAGSGAPAICHTASQWVCSPQMIAGWAIVTLGPELGCPGYSLAGILDPWDSGSRITVDPTTNLIAFVALTSAGCSGGIETWVNDFSVDVSLIPVSPGVTFWVEHLMIVSIGGTPTWYTPSNNATRFTLST